jgi:dTDP-4-dehydrorhamnose 3,5-epimerase
MKLRATPLPGAYVVEPVPISDNRGFFARTFSVEEFRQAGLDSDVSQCSVSFNSRAGTLRGIHYQMAPHAESKLVRCTRGEIYDVIVDLRDDSPTFKRWFAVVLSADNRLALFIPKGIAHGFQTLSAGSEVHYQISVPYSAGAARGIRWNDPAFKIDWPEGDRTISDRDLGYPDFDA